MPVVKSRRVRPQAVVTWDPRPCVSVSWVRRPTPRASPIEFVVAIDRCDGWKLENGGIVG